jgi:hypothetical protein
MPGGGCWISGVAWELPPRRSEITGGIVRPRLQAVAASYNFKLQERGNEPPSRSPKKVLIPWER